MSFKDNVLIGFDGFIGFIGFIILVIFLFLAFGMPVLAIMNCLSLKKYYEDQDQNKLNTEDKHKFNVAIVSFYCIIVSIVSLFLALVSFGICVTTDVDAFAYFGFICLVIGTISAIISGILSFVVSALLIDIFKSNEDRQTEVVLAAIYLTFAALYIIGSIMKNNNDILDDDFTIYNYGKIRWKR
jgi:hypothetical protein